MTKSCRNGYIKDLSYQTIKLSKTIRFVNPTQNFKLNKSETCSIMVFRRRILLTVVFTQITTLKMTINSKDNSKIVTSLKKSFNFHLELNRPIKYLVALKSMEESKRLLIQLSRLLPTLQKDAIFGCQQVPRIRLFLMKFMSFLTF